MEAPCHVLGKAVTVAVTKLAGSGEKSMNLRGGV